jgi:hypothetical protein
LTNAATQDDRTQNEDTKIVIKMLVETEAEKTDSQITTNRVSEVIRAKYNFSPLFIHSNLIQIHILELRN